MERKGGVRRWRVRGSLGHWGGEGFKECDFSFSIMQVSFKKEISEIIMIIKNFANLEIVERNGSLELMISSKFQ